MRVSPAASGSYADWRGVRRGKAGAVPEVEVGNAYEFLIKKRADDSGEAGYAAAVPGRLRLLPAHSLGPRPEDWGCRPIADSFGGLAPD